MSNMQVPESPLAQPHPLEKFGRRVTHKKKVRLTPRERSPAEPRRKKSHSTPTQSHQHRHTHKPKNTHAHTHTQAHPRPHPHAQTPAHPRTPKTHTPCDSLHLGAAGENPSASTTHMVCAARHAQASPVQHTWCVLADARAKLQFNTHGVC